MAASLFSCKRFYNPFSDQKILAEVGTAVLYENDVVSIFTPGITPEDSIKLLESYVDRWVKDQLKIDQAEQVFESSQQDVDRMVEDYRQSLLKNKLDQYYIDSFIDTLFTESEIRSYYNENRKDFILDKTIVKGRIVKFPKNFRQEQELRKLMLSGSESDYQAFVGLCTKNSLGLTEFTSWNDFSQFQAVLPRPDKDDYDYLLAAPNKIHEIADGPNKYFVRVLDFRKVGDYTPPESVQDVIRRIIFNRRKQDIVRRHEDSLYNKALQQKKVSINIK